MAVARPRARLGARPNSANIKSRNLPLGNLPFGNPRLSAISLSLDNPIVTEDGQNDISMQQRMVHVIVRRVVRDFATTQFTLDVGCSYEGLTPCCHLKIPKKLFVVATHTHKYTHTHTHEPQQQAHEPP